MASFSQVVRAHVTLFDTQDGRISDPTEALTAKRQSLHGCFDFAVDRYTLNASPACIGMGAAHWGGLLWYIPRIYPGVPNRNAMIHSWRGQVVSPMSLANPDRRGLMV